MGIDYLVYTQHRICFNDSDLLYNNYNFNGFVNDQSLDPFANIGLCYKIGETILLDLEYRHLLDNWGVGELNDVNEFISSDNRSVQIHMINFSGAILF